MISFGCCMKIVFIIPSITNFHTFLNELSDSLLKDGHKVYLIAGEKPVVKGESPYSDLIDCEWIKMEFPRSLQPQKHFITARKIDNIIQDIHPDLIHVHFSAAMFTVSLAKKPNWPQVIATIHGLAWPTRKGRSKLILKKAEISSAKKMDQVIVLNKDDLIKLKDNGVHNSHIITNYGIGCNTDQFDQEKINSDAKSSLKRKFKIKDNDIVFIFIGRQTQFKGFNKVIRAFMQIYHSRSPYHLLLIGENDYIHKSGLNAIEESLLSQIPSIHQIGWKANIETFLAIADINVFPSSREGLPVNLMESLSMGIPVITIDSRGCNEIINHNENGIILEDDSVESLSSAMKHLGENFVLRSKLSQNGLLKRADYDRSIFIKKQKEFYSTFIHQENDV